MRIAFISDVHANVVALRAVIEEIDRLGIGTIVNAGDVVGYYPFPNETIELLSERKVISIKGNHDRSVLNASVGRMNFMASIGVRWTSEHLDIGSVRYLHCLKNGLDVPLGTVRASIHHGSPFDEDEYVYENDVSDELLEACPGSSLLVLGHTHVPYIVKVGRGFVVNPGSVGQPRDGDPRASFMVYDTITQSFDIRRVDYDISEVERAVTSEGLPIELARRLWRGL
ncbi:MAG: metallophosphoesterase family protein [Methanomassiliicoccales archaeon]|nr:MAG: metallophosphoesterase family protein [Methanomassiliicoccales archaeon]